MIKKIFFFLLCQMFLYNLAFGQNTSSITIEVTNEKNNFKPQGIPTKGKIAVLIESHFDEQEFDAFKTLFPQNGYEVDFVSYLWNNKALIFNGNDLRKRVKVTKDITLIDINDYKAIILIGGYAMDRLRYDKERKDGVKNESAAVSFLRKVVSDNKLKIGTICHSLWLFTASKDLLNGKKVTCAHNIIDDVVNANGIVIYEGNQTAEIVVDGNLISCNHPKNVDKLISKMIEEINNTN